MKKLMVIILVISLWGGLLSGCSNNKKNDADQQTSAPAESQEPSMTTPSTTPESKPIRTHNPDLMADNFILPEELDSLIKGTCGGYDFTVQYDAAKWFQVDDQNLFVMKFEHIDPGFPWTVASSSNAVLVETIRKSDYDYLVMKFLKANTETVVVFEAVNEDGVVGSTLSDAPDGIYFAVAIGEF